MTTYRNDIDGLRAFAVISVIIFHLGFLPNGYLGVDVFFVISGYLITGIIYRELLQNRFSLITFYKRRIRRIIPLLLFITSISLILGVFYMLPDDLENMAQSVVASNLSLNNILMLITSADYWATKNEYKPLMHTWSLGVEEQFYFIYPFLLLLAYKVNNKLLLPLLTFISIASISFFIFGNNDSSKFYLLQYRFFELSIGGLFAIIFNEREAISEQYKIVYYISAFSLLLIIMIPYKNNQLNVLLTTMFTAVVLAVGNYYYSTDKIIKMVFQNKFVVFVGKISFSLYLWHQLVLAYGRYIYIEQIQVQHSVILIVLIFALSIATYYAIENPFRNKTIISTRKVYIILVSAFLFSTSSALYIYSIGGLYKDFKSIGLLKSDINQFGYNLFSSTDNIHIHYNEKIRSLDRNFENNHSSKILVIGNSFGRDVVNILLESELNERFEISYFDDNRLSFDSNFFYRWNKADMVIYAAEGILSKENLINLSKNKGYELNFEKFYCFGTKDFGHSNGIHYNRLKSISNYANYYTSMKPNVLAIENALKQEFGNRYISLIDLVKNSNNQVRVFTDEGLFISQDTVHLTKAGAKFYAKHLSKILNDLFKI